MRRSFATLIGLAILALPPLCTGATPAPATVAPAAAAPAAVSPIAAAEILDRADADERFVQQIIGRSRQPDPAEALVAPLEALFARSRRLSETFGRDAKALPATELQSLEIYWDFYADRLDAWADELQRVIARSAEAAAELARRRAAWDATRAGATAGGLPDALVVRIGAILSDIERADQALSSRLERQLAIASRGHLLQAAIDADRDAVRAASAHLYRRLLTIDSPPLAEAWSSRAPARQVLSTLNVRSTLQTEFLGQYVDAYAWTLRALAAAALALLVAMLWVARRGGARPSISPDASSPTPALRRPFASWLLIVLLGMLFVSRDAPPIVQELALFLAPIPVLRLLPRRVYAALGPWPYVVTALYLVLRLGFVVVGTPIFERMYLLAVGMLTLAALAWFLLKLRSRGPTSGSIHPRILRAVAATFVVTIVVAMIANAAGNTSLAEALTRGVIVSSYMGLVLYAADTVLDAILGLMLGRDPAAESRGAARHAQELLESLRWLLNGALLAAWVVAALKSFRIYPWVADAVRAMLTHPFEAGQISITAGGVLLFLASVWVSLTLAKLIRIVLRDEVLPRFELPHGAGNSIATLTYYAVATLGLIFALAAAGFQPSQLTIVVGALSVGIGFGLQNIVNNFVSGLILMFERPIQPGDIIEVPGASGTVREIGMRATRLRTADGADVVVPNGTLLSQNLLNWTLGEKTRRLEVAVSIAPGSDLKRALDVLAKAATTSPGVATWPAPSVTFSGASPGSLDFVVSAWTGAFGSWRAARSGVAVHVHEALAAAGIEIAPARAPALARPAA